MAADKRIVIVLREDVRLVPVKEMIQEQVIDEGFTVKAELGIFEIELDTPNFAITEAIRRLLEPLRPPMVVEKPEVKEVDEPKQSGYSPSAGVFFFNEDYIGAFRLPGLSRNFLEGLKVNCGAEEVEITTRANGAYGLWGPRGQIRLLVAEALIYINPLATK